MTDAKKPIEITSEAQFDEALKAAPGEVLVDFVLEGCEPCAVDKPKIEALASGCDVTVLRVDVDKVAALADRFNINAMPTLLHSKTAAGMTPKTAKEVEPETMAKKLKCARTKP